MTVAACAASALAFALYARVEWPWFVLGWCGLVPWLVALDRCRSIGRALLCGLAMTELFTLAVFWWFIAAIAGYADAPWPAGLVVVVLTAPLMQPQFIVCAAARHLARRQGANDWQSAIVTAAAYVAAEWALPKLFSDTIGHGFLASRLLRQAADVVGAHGLTFVLLIANDCLLRILLPPLAGEGRDGGGEERASGPPSWPSPASGGRKPAVIALVLIVATLALYGWLRLRQVDVSHGDTIVAAAVQADISHYDRLAREIGTYDAVRLILDRHVALSDAALAQQPVQLLVWPETVYPTTFGTPKSADGAAFDAEIVDFVGRAGVPLVFGTYDTDGGQEYNAAVALDPRAAAAPPATYRKAQLFPFTERVPALLDSAPIRRLLPWLGTWRAGHGPRVLDVRLADGKALRLAPLICYDAVNPTLAIAAVREGAELLVTLSNDSWFAHGGGPRLHLVVSAFRSIETRRPQVRATNTGISAIIDASGEVVSTLGVHEHGALSGALRLGRGSTVLLMFGDWFGAASAIVLVMVAADLSVRGRRAGASAVA